MDAEKFVKAWVEASKNDQQYDWIAKQLGVHLSKVAPMAVRLRKAGVKLPKLARKHKAVKYDVATLNRIIAEETQPKYEYSRNL